MYVVIPGCMWSDQENKPENMEAIEKSWKIFLTSCAANFTYSQTY